MVTRWRDEAEAVPEQRQAWTQLKELDLRIQVLHFSFPYVGFELCPQQEDETWTQNGSKQSEPSRIQSWKISLIHKISIKSFQHADYRYLWIYSFVHRMVTHLRAHLLNQPIRINHQSAAGVFAFYNDHKALSYHGNYSAEQKGHHGNTVWRTWSWLHSSNFPFLVTMVTLSVISRTTSWFRNCSTDSLPNLWLRHLLQPIRDQPVATSSKVLLHAEAAPSAAGLRGSTGQQRVGHGHPASVLLHQESPQLRQPHAGHQVRGEDGGRLVGLVQVHEAQRRVGKQGGQKSVGVQGGGGGGGRGDAMEASL